MKKYFCILSAFLFIVIFPLIPQEAAPETNSNNLLYTNLYPVEPAKAKVDITGYRGVQIGMTMKDTMAILQKDPLITLSAKYINSIIDISYEESETFMSLNPNKFFKSGYFLFKNDALYSMIIRFQPKQVDFLEILTALNEKYGDGAFMDANTVVWNYGTRQLILERPTTLKYSDMDVVNSVIINYTNLFVTNMNAILDGL